MPKSLADIIADAASFSDDLTVNFGDNPVKLGDLRAFRKATQTETDAAKRLREEAEAEAKEAAGILAAIQKAAKEMNASPSRKAEEIKAPDWKSDPLYAPLVPVMDALEKQAKDSLAMANAMQRELAKSQSFFMIERMRNEYAQAPETWKKKYSFEKAVEESLRAGDVMSFGQGDDAVKMPTLSKKIHEGTEEDRINAAVTQAVTTAQQKWEREQKVNAVGKPGKFTTRIKTDKPPIQKIEELTSEAVQKAEAEDPEFAKLLQDGGLLQ